MNSVGRKSEVRGPDNVILWIKVTELVSYLGWRDYPLLSMHLAIQRRTESNYYYSTCITIFYSLGNQELSFAS
jgi:hypothetical protein